MTKKILALLGALVLILAFCAGCQKAAVEYVVLDESLADEEYGIGFRLTDVALANEVQKILVEIKNDGKLADISNKWFGKDSTTITAAFEPAAVPDGDTSLDDVKAAGKLIMGLDDSFPPMGFRDENQEIVGFDVDLAREVCKRMGVSLELQPITWTSNINELNAKTVDCLWNGMTINDDRKTKVLFSMPYMKNRQVIIVTKASGIKSLKDLEGKTLALQAGSSAGDALNENPDVKSKLKDGKAVEVKDNVLAMKDLGAGGSDAVLMDEVVARYQIEMAKKSSEK